MHGLSRHLIEACRKLKGLHLNHAENELGCNAAAQAQAVSGLVEIVGHCNLVVVSMSIHAVLAVAAEAMASVERAELRLV